MVSQENSLPSAKWSRWKKKISMVVVLLLTGIGPFQFHVSFIIIGQVVGPIEIHVQHLNPILQRTMHCLQQITFIDTLSSHTLVVVLTVRRWLAHWARKFAVICTSSKEISFALLSNASANRWHRLEIVANAFRVSSSLVWESWAKVDACNWMFAVVVMSNCINQGRRDSRTPAWRFDRSF